jgi:hypothetical protein
MKVFVAVAVILACGGCAQLARLDLSRRPGVMAVRSVRHPIPDAPPCAAYGLVSLAYFRSSLGQVALAQAKAGPLFEAYERDFHSAVAAWPAFAANCAKSDRMFEVVAFEKVSYVIHRDGNEAASLDFPVSQPLYCGPGAYSPPWPLHPK